MILNLLFSLFILLCYPAYASNVENLSDLNVNKVAVLNDNFKALNDNANKSKNLLNSYFSSDILNLANGGTGVALTDPNADKILFWDDSAGNITWLSATSPLTISGTSLGLTDYAAGAYLIAGPSAIVAQLNGVTGTSYTKVIEAIVPRAGTLRIIFGLGGSNAGAGNVLGRIYRNGVAVGTIRSKAYNANWTEYSEDIAGWTAGDLLQLYTRNDQSDAAGQTGGSLRMYELTPSTEVFTTGGIGKGSGPLIYSGAYIPTDTFVLITTMGSIGDLYINTAGGAATTLYVKTAAATWTAK